jgi:hypothetical protein
MNALVFGAGLDAEVALPCLGSDEQVWNTKGSQDARYGAHGMTEGKR